VILIVDHDAGKPDLHWYSWRAARGFQVESVVGLVAATA
jgi:hypothetical protein